MMTASTPMMMIPDDNTLQTIHDYIDSFALIPNESIKPNIFYNCVVVYQKGGSVIQPMNSRDIMPKNVPMMGWGWEWS